MDLTSTLPEDATVLGTTGLSPTGDGGVEWDGETRPASVTYELAGNRTGRAPGPEGASGSLLLADVGEWAIVDRPSLGVQYRFRGSVTVSRSATVDGEGVVGTGLAYLGPYDSTTREAHGQRFTLVVPAAARLAEAPDAIFASVGDASDALRVGDRDERVLMIAAPTSVDWGVEGLQLGDADFYVTADEPVDEAANTWLHEYVHTRQNLSLASDGSWFEEASATFYAALLTLEQERIDYRDFRDHLGLGTRSSYADVVLADPATWTAGAEYLKGALVAGELDRRLRLATDSGTTLQAAVSRMNGASEYAGEDLLAFLERHGGADLRDAGRRYTTTTAAPDPWDASAHQRAFGQLPARIEVTLPDRSNASAWRVTGPYRNGSVDPRDLALVPGETLSVDVPVTNAGGTAGDYGFVVRLGGNRVTTRNGTVPAGTTVWEQIAVSPEATGTPTLSTAGDGIGLRVVEPAGLATASLDVNRSSVAVGEPVGVTVTIRNGEAMPGESTVTVTADGATVGERLVRLPPGGSATLSVPVRFDAAGEHTVAVGDRTVTVSVAGADDDDGGDGTGFLGGEDNGDGDGTSSVDGAGFGPATALLAILLVALLVALLAGARRTRRR